MHQIEIVYFIVEYVKRLTWVTLLKHQDYGYKRIIQKAITSASTVCIGSNVLLGSGVRIFDTDFHPISANDRKKGILDCIKTAPVKIEDNVFIGPCACFTNDKYPVRINYELQGPKIRRGASIGGNTTFLSNVEIGEGSIVAAGAIVIHSVPPFYLAIGTPARIKPLPDHLKVPNKL